ncbi:MAG: hypothetical protein P0Y56_13220 [Candidatus Andeanibacterium colombiense]|uniref:Uncharacterized protein n=1 Tax=Candidatus Andeanibacterium colombiense TaxID=3121345 RepID=A0AAJ5X7H9_9SPHN|nr:MAG: hypothetical protein P0Y56_13220 [Sphingomonadaceae bacterium]
MSAQLIVAGPSYCGLIATKSLIIIGYCGYCVIAGGPPNRPVSRTCESDFPSTYNNYNKYNKFTKKRRFSAPFRLIAILIARNKYVERGALRANGIKLRMERLNCLRFRARSRTMYVSTYKQERALPMNSPAIAPALSPAGTRVGNGSALLAGIDGRSTGARRFKEVVSELCAGMTDAQRQPSGVQMLLARRAATLSIWCEEAEAKMARGDPIDIGEFTSATNALRRILSDAGLICPPSPQSKL